MSLDQPAGTALPRRLAGSGDSRTAALETLIADATAGSLRQLLPTGAGLSVAVTAPGEVTVFWTIGGEHFCERQPYGSPTLAEAVWVGRGIAFQISERFSAGSPPRRVCGVGESAAE